MVWIPSAAGSPIKWVRCLEWETGITSIDIHFKLRRSIGSESKPSWSETKGNGDDDRSYYSRLRGALLFLFWNGDRRAFGQSSSHPSLKRKRLRRGANSFRFHASTRLSLLDSSGG